MKKVYIAHPLLGDMDRERPNIDVPFENWKKVDTICRHIVEKHPDVLPISPIHMLSFLGVFERERSLTICLSLLEMADELWVFGDWERSEGCRMEVERARELGLPVVFDGER